MRQVESNVHRNSLEIKKFTTEILMSITKMNNYSINRVYQCLAKL